MPELPEMETYRRHLTELCHRRQIVDVEVGREKSLNVPAKIFASAVKGASFAHFSRAGKHLVFHLSNGLYLLNHLMLGGAIFCGRPDEAPKRTFQVTLHLDDGRRLYWYGLRLGWLHLLTEEERRERLADLGIDPLAEEFTADHLAAHLSGRRGALKPYLVDQARFPGIGNCYSDEICWSAHIHPLRPANRLTRADTQNLWESMRETLNAAVMAGGYTETPFYVGDKLTGGYLSHLKVYDRNGEPCPRCGAPIALVDASRKIFACLNCQPLETSPASVLVAAEPAALRSELHT